MQNQLTCIWPQVCPLKPQAATLMMWLRSNKLNNTSLINRIFLITTLNNSFFQTCLNSHYPALSGKHRRPPGWCTLWRHRILGRRMMEARRGRCTLLPRCSWRTSQRDKFLNRDVSVNLRRPNIHPAIPIINSSNQAVLTKVDIQESSVGPLHQDFLAGSIESFVHEVNPISHQRTQPLCIALKHRDSNTYLDHHEQGLLLKYQSRATELRNTIICGSVSVSRLHMMTRPHLQLLQFTIDIDVEVWIHRQEMFCQHTKPARKRECVC